LRKGYRKAQTTIADVARLAGVSTATVSKALNGTDRVSPDTRDRVRAIARELNWQANPLARNLVLRRSHLIGLMVASITNNFCAQLYDGAEAYAAERGYSLLLCVTEDDPQREISVLKRLTDAARVDGIIAIPAPLPEGKSPFYGFDRTQTPFVLVLRRVPGLECDCVICDDKEGGRQVTEYLIQLGHRRIAYVYDGGQRDCTNVMERRIGWQQALEAAGIGYDPCLCSEVSLSASPAEQVALRNMAEARRPTAIFAHNDRTAVAVLEWLRYAGKRVPEDMALAGFANMNLATLVTPPLTSVEFGIRQIGMRAAKTLIDRLEAPDAAPHKIFQNIVVSPQLVVRESTGAALCQR
jgi:DNA-binding LacI/PurR family transcriptional regulator